MTGCTSTDLPAINLFDLDDDRQLGADLAAEIESDPETYPLLDRADYPEAYDHLERIRDEILASGEVSLADAFDWELHLIDDDETLNAFAAPGGYIYIYTGLIRFLDSEDAFAGVLAHEIAHADQRHTTQQLTRAYGISSLLALVLGEDPGLVPEIAAGLVQLSFSREHETESDNASVLYLCNTPYAANGAADFFEKLEGAEIPEFLSTHPSSDHRVEDIDALALDLGCETTPTEDGAWEDFIASLPEPG